MGIKKPIKKPNYWIIFLKETQKMLGVKYFFQLNNAIRLPYGRKRIDRPKQN